jgi:hypothetical protein
MLQANLQELSHPESEEARLKQFVMPSLDANGQPFWLGKGQKTVDVETIIQRLDGLRCQGSTGNF